MSGGLEGLRSPRYRWVALAVMALGFGIVVIDNTVLNVSIPYMIRDLHAQLSQIEWAVSGYALTIATLLIVFGRISDRVGRKLMFIVGMAVFAIGSFLASISPTPIFLILTRAIVQAIGATIVLTAGLALLAATFQGPERGIAFGVWGAVAGASASIGPLLGGYLTTYVSWRWSLRVNVIVAAVAIVGAWVFLSESKGESEKVLDLPGSVLSALGIFLIVFGFTEGQRFGWWRPAAPFSLLGVSWPFSGISVVPVAFALGILVLVVFVFAELRLERKGVEPFVPLSLFGDRGFSIGSFSLLIEVMGIFGVFFVLPIYFEVVRGLSAFQVGTELLSVSLSVFVAGIVSGVLIRRIGMKTVIIAGNVFLALGAGLLPLVISVESSWLTLLAPFVALGVGFGLSSSQVNNLIISSAPPQLAGTASGEANVMRQVGISIGIALLGATLTTAFNANITARIAADSSIPSADKTRIAGALRHVDVASGEIPPDLSFGKPSLGRTIKRDVDESLVASMKVSMLVNFVASVIVLALSFLLPSGVRHEEHEAPAGAG